jgi:hypothetical protein
MGLFFCFCGITDTVTTKKTIPPRLGNCKGSDYDLGEKFFAGTLETGRGAGIGIGAGLIGFVELCFTATR